MVVVCNVCKKRKAFFKTVVTVLPYVKEEICICGICKKKYDILKERYLYKAYAEVVDQVRNNNN